MYRPTKIIKTFAIILAVFLAPLLCQCSASQAQAMVNSITMEKTSQMPCHQHHASKSSAPAKSCKCPMMTSQAKTPEAPDLQGRQLLVDSQNSVYLYHSVLISINQHSINTFQQISPYQNCRNSIPLYLQNSILQV